MYMFMRDRGLEIMGKANGQLVLPAEQVFNRIVQ
jgi:hypothetical protein